MKKILMYRWKAYNYIDIKQGFVEAGYEVEEVSQKLLNYDVDDEFAEFLKKKIKENTYEFFFTVNYFALVSNVCEECGLPYVCWSCDNPLISMYHQSVFNSCNRIFLFDLTNVREFQGMGVENVYHLPLAVDTGRIDYLLDNATDLSSYKNEIAFVGSLYEKNSYDKMKYSMSDYLQGYFEAAMEAQKDLQGINIIDRMLTPEILMELEQHFKLEKTPDSLSDLNLIFSVTTLGFKIAQKQRRSILIELSKHHDVSIYTNSDTKDLLQVNYRGGVDYWTEMPKVFSNSAINLNMTIPNIKSGIPLRCFDVMGSRGFLITNFQAEMPMFFENEQDLVMYYNEHDLFEKVKFYLKHDEERNRIAQNGYEKVKKEHSYSVRIAEMLQTIKETV